jgi:hypothetical protein
MTIPQAVDVLLALAMLAMVRRVRRLETRVTRIALARGYYGPPPETER